MDIEFAQITLIPVRDIVNNTGQIEGVPANPRNITREGFESLKQRIAERNLLGAFPLKVFLCGGKYVTLGGNQRLRAAKALQIKSVPCIIIPEDADADTLQEIVIVENEHDGDNDWDMLANQWDANKLAKWGVRAGNWGKDESDEEGKGKKKRRVCIYIECEAGDELRIGNKLFMAGDSITLSELKSMLNL